MTGNRSTPMHSVSNASEPSVRLKRSVVVLDSFFVCIVGESCLSFIKQFVILDSLAQIAASVGNGFGVVKRRGLFLCGFVAILDDVIIVSCELRLVLIPRLFEGVERLRTAVCEPYIRIQKIFYTMLHEKAIGEHLKIHGAFLWQNSAFLIELKVSLL